MFSLTGNTEGDVCCGVRPFARPNFFPPNVDTGNYVLDEHREVVVDECRGNEASFPVEEIFTECEVGLLMDFYMMSPVVYVRFLMLKPVSDNSRRS